MNVLSTLKETTLAKVMSVDLITLEEEETVDKVAAIFKNRNIHHIPVVKQTGCLAGIISSDDFQKISYGKSLFRQPAKAEHNQALYRSLLAKNIMTKDVVALAGTDTIEKALSIFKENQFRAIPIVEKGKLAGIVTPMDLLVFAYGV